jgi:lysyl-tRNA synthetase class 2
VTAPDRGARAPSDIAATSPHGRLAVAGRIRREGLVLAVHDALASCPTDLALDALPEGHLAIVEGTWTGAALEGSAIAWSQQARPGPDVRRFADAGVAANLRHRASAERAVRAYFEREGFLEVATPAGVPCPGLDLHLDAFAIGGARAPRWLSTSPEFQMKRLLVGGIPRCFQLARCFRNGELGARHEPEFTMLEWYRAFATSDAILDDTEAIVEAVARAVTGSASLRIGGRDVSLTRPFERVTVADAFARAARIDEAECLRLANEDEDTFFRVLVEEVEPYLAQAPAPLVLHRYPARQASLARLCADDPRWADRFEVMAAGVELSNGFVELTDPDEQRARFERDRTDRSERGLPVYPLDERFLASLGEGMPPSAGNALGFDRLVAAALGTSRIADVNAFPDAEL